MAREDLHFRLRLPEDLKAQIETQADMNSRSMTAEIVSRLQSTFDVRSMARAALLEAAIKEFQQASKDMAHQADVLKWMHEQQATSMRLLELVAETNGHLKPEFMETLRAMLARRGQETGFPEPPAEE